RVVPSPLALSSHFSPSFLSHLSPNFSPGSILLSLRGSISTRTMHRRALLVLPLLVCLVESLPNQQRCIHGKIAAGKCECDDGYTGTICHREMHCLTFQRTQSGGCTACVPGWEKSECDEIVCEHGKPDLTSMKCNCEPPYSGEFCNELETANVYSHYNNKAASMNPVLLSICIIPLAIIVWACNTYSKKRRAKKVEHLLEATVNRDLKSSHVRQLLYGKK
ncbi:hypothetical protein PRIPAC_93582, partial [Pristionchus pacificus]